MAEHPSGNPVATYDLAAAERLPSNILFGTSSWNYPGWQGSIYREPYKNDKEFKAKSLGEYARFPWFRTVGIDSFFYAPPRRSTLEQYAALVPENFRWASKVWEEITIPRYAKHARYGKRAGLENLNFLNAELFCERVLKPHEPQEIRKHAGPFIFEFQRMGVEWTREPQRFAERLGAFLLHLPRDFLYAVEIRNAELLCAEYFRALNSAGATHCFNHWTYMPPLVEQMKAAADGGGLTSEFFAARILTPIGMTYEQAVEQFSPYSAIQSPIPSMRQDIVRLARRALERKVPAFILVNNRCEGHAPGTIDAIGRMIVEQLDTSKMTGG